jgi:hypothetical protein
LPPLGGAALFFVIYFGGLFTFSWVSGTALPRPGLDLAFTQDTVALVLYPFLVPVGAFLALRFYTQVENAFERLYAEGVVRVPLDEYNAFLRQLHRRYNSIPLHVGALALGVAAFASEMVAGHVNGVRDWFDLGMGAGAIYQLIVGLIAWYATHLVLIKVLVTALAIRRVFDWPIDVQPLHPDGCGGLRLFTEIAVTIALFAATVGGAVVLIVMADLILHGKAPAPGPVLVAVLVETMTPLVFFTCLYRAHRVMKAGKEAMLSRVHARFQKAFHELQQELDGDGGIGEASEEIVRLDAVHQVVQRLPVWPTNTQMVMQVLLSVALPLGLLVGQVLLEWAVFRGD